MKCNECGQEIPDDSIFCPDCGSKQIGEINGAKKGNSEIIYYILMILFYFVAVIALFFLLTETGIAENINGFLFLIILMFGPVPLFVIMEIVLGNKL